MPKKRIKGPKKTGVARPMTQQEREYHESYDADIVQPARRLQVNLKKKNTRNINIWDKA